jgi:hypothetical protein
MSRHLAGLFAVQITDKNPLIGIKVSCEFSLFGYDRMVFNKVSGDVPCAALLDCF